MILTQRGTDYGEKTQPGPERKTPAGADRVNHKHNQRKQHKWNHNPKNSQ